MDTEELIQAIDSVLEIIEPHPPLDRNWRQPDSSDALAFLKQELEKQRDQNTPKTTLQKTMNLYQS